ncbi:hypothetical protein TNIN_454941 [Trichonephila inaurata madagascariensis]|uniref:Uncharacterized protein n=1 Tax=Trichonephila inaurata madagascariensis TaxID=2747483 RepID=A0A8X6IMB5_9ARAC|nr:hypothetical protein TNIN_454941 [Trichonephila inaurata madagascariensis]
MEERVLARFEAAFSKSTLAVVYKMGISQPVLYCFVYEECMHPYYLQRVQSLNTDDYPRRANLVQQMLGMKNNDPRFFVLVLFRDEAKFSTEEIFNMGSQHV